MSTRVDKGGPKFKPILKSKARPSATPVPQDVRARHSVEPHASMPPPSIIPDRDPSAAPSASAEHAPSSGIMSGRSVRPPGLQVQSSKPSNAGTPLALPSARPVIIQPMRVAPTPPVESLGTSRAQTPARPVISIASTSSVATPSRGVPIALSRSTPAPPPSLPATLTAAPEAASTFTSVPPTTSVPTTTASSSTKGKKRAAPETEDRPEGEHSEPTQQDDARGGIARKRPKLSIVQAEEDRVKKPKRKAKGKKKTAASGTESGTEGGGGTSGAEVSKKKRAPRKKKPVDENATDNAAGEPSRPKRTRTKKKPTQETHDDGDAGAQDTDPQSESDAPAKKKRKKRQKSVTAEPEGTPDPIDPTQVTMGAICDDPRSGRMSSRWETSQLQHAEAKKRAREERDRVAAEAAEEERETGRTGVRKGTSRPSLPSQSEGGAEESVTDNNGGDPDDFTYNESLKASHYAPQVRIGANGEIVLDMESLQVDRAADPEIAEDAYSFVEESDQSKFTNSNSWSKRKSVRWGKEDTAMFYDALRQFGQNFDLIARVLPGRTYRMCKNKFKAEDKKNPGLIDDALKNGVAVDIDTLSRMTGKDFSGPTPVIEAKRALDLRESDAPAERPAPDQETGSNAPIENQPPRADHSNAGDGEAEAATGRDASPPRPPIDPLLDNLNAMMRSPSPPPIEDILDAIKSVPPSAGPSTAASSGPVTISVPTRAAAQTSPSSIVSQTRVAVEPQALSAEKVGKKKAVQEEGVEVLGILEDDLHDLYD